MYERIDYQLEYPSHNSTNTEIVAYIPVKVFGKMLKTDHKENLQELTKTYKVVRVKELTDSIGLVTSLKRVAGTHDNNLKNQVFKRLAYMNMGIRAHSERSERDPRLEFTLSGDKLPDTRRYGMQGRVLLPRRPSQAVESVATKAMLNVADTLKFDTSRITAFGAHIMQQAGVRIATELIPEQSLHGYLSPNREVTLSSRQLAGPESQYIGMAALIAIARAETILHPSE